MRAPLPPHRRRRSIRVAGYDYARPGAYFVTICTHDRAPLFGAVVEGRMRLNEAGRVVVRCWRAIPDHFPAVRLDAFVIMPDHLHGLLWIASPEGEGCLSGPPEAGAEPRPFRSPSRTVGSIVRGFKIGVTTWMRAHRDVWDVWQRNYYEHIVRDEEDLARIRRYIAENPMRWAARGQ